MVCSTFCVAEMTAAPPYLAVSGGQRRASEVGPRSPAGHTLRSGSE